MTTFERWWSSVGLAEFVRLCEMFHVPVTDDTINVGKFTAWRAWNASTNEGITAIYAASLERRRYMDAKLAEELA